ncbi:flagellar hook-length control protein FliK [Propionivibrio sp.]|uniref:flagellar hook-length control protein FliK n=1 Tax=Propionivibrio sp. TaxID=2212460 RepID=UPI0039E24A84
MPITLVSALPKSAPLPAPDAAAGTESTDAVQDFTSLLLGQLAALRPDAGSLPGAAPAAEADDSAGGTDDASAAGDPSALLAALAQAPFEQRSTLAPAAAPAGNETTAIAAHASPADASLAAAGRTAPDASQTLPADRLPAAASEPAAKFAALPETTAAATQEPAALPAAAAAVTPGAHARHDDAPTLPVATSLHDRDWHDDFAQKVTWIATSHKQSAELTLNPPSMGSIQISLKLDSDTSTATATFVSSNAEVRETIETALPRLREMLAGAGIQLGQAQVSAESFRQAPGNGQQPGGSASPSGNDMAILAPDSLAAGGATTVVGAGRGLVDTFV